jgi:hypothetical protein
LVGKASGSAAVQGLQCGAAGFLVKLLVVRCGELIRHRTRGRAAGLCPSGNQWTATNCQRDQWLIPPLLPELFIPPLTLLALFIPFELLFIPFEVPFMSFEPLMPPLIPLPVPLVPLSWSDLQPRTVIASTQVRAVVVRARIMEISCGFKAASEVVGCDPRQLPQATAERVPPR